MTGLAGCKADTILLDQSSSNQSHVIRREIPPKAAVMALHIGWSVYCLVGKGVEFLPVPKGA